MPKITALLLDGIRPAFQDIVGNQPQTRALWHQFHSLVIKDGLLYRKFEHLTGNPTLSKFQLVLPEKHVKSTVKYYHSSLSCGQHFGREKTLSLLKRYFYWPNMFDSIYEVTAECETCFKAKGRTYKVKPPLELFRDGTLHDGTLISVALLKRRPWTSSSI